MTKQQILDLINSDITTNGVGSITGAVLNNVLTTMANELPDYAEVDVTSGDILTLASSPVQILGTAATGSYYDIEKVAFEFSATGTYSVNGSEYISLISSNSNTVYSCPDTILELTDDSVVLRSQSDFSTIAQTQEAYNLQIVTSTQSAGTDPTGSMGTMKVKVWYHERTLG